MQALQFHPPALKLWSCAARALQPLPFREVFSGAVLVVDIAGFTELTWRLAQHGASGAEEINRILKRVFDDIVAVIEGHGGAVIGYEADAVTAGWRSETGEAPDKANAACAACAAEIVRVFSHREVEGQRIDVRVAMGSGGIEFIHLGAADGRRYFVPAGSAMDEAAQLSREARLGQAPLDSDTIAPQASKFTAKSQISGAEEGVSTDPGGPAAATPAPLADTEEALRPYLIPQARMRLTSALADWMAELRQITLLFVKVSLRGQANDLEAVNAAAMRAAVVLESMGGGVLRIALRDDLLLIETAFGLPDAANRNDDWRAVGAAMELQAEMRAAGLDISAGLATGRVFCGPFGATHFRNYNVIGAAANLSARLRDVAAGRILVDDETQRISGNSVQFDGPWPMQLPGIRQTVPIFLPSARSQRNAAGVSPDVVGRERERAFLKDLLNRSDDSVQVAMIHGAGGIGKSTLVAFFLAELDFGTDEVASGMADALDRQTPYLAWRRILRQFLGLGVHGSRSDVATADLLARLQEAVGDNAFAPLLNDVIDLNLPENRVTASMTGNVRAENLRGLMQSIVLHHLRGPVRVLVLEDSHWFDASSIRLLSDVIRAGPPALIVVTSRKEDSLAEDLTALAGDGHAIHLLPLQPLDEAEIVSMAEMQFSHGKIPEPLRHFILRTSDGVPLFIEELCHMAASVSSDELEAWAEGSQHLALPRQLEAAILSRVDTLSPEDQRVLKTASVFGRRVERSHLARIEPLALSGIDVDAAVSRILAVRLLQVDPTRSTGVEFRHQIIRDMVYDGMLSEQKAETHAAVARSLEAEASSDDIETLPRLLSHWRHAGNVSKILRYLERVAALRLRQFDNAGAIALLSEFFERLERDGQDGADMRRARCWLMLGRAYSGLGKMAEAESAFRTGLAELDLPLPNTRGSVLWGLLREIVGQIRQRRRENRMPLVSAEMIRPLSPRLERAEMAAGAHELLTQIYYFFGQKDRLLHSALSGANYAARLGVPTASLAINTAGLGAICGVIPLRSQASYYLGRATKIAEVLDAPSVSGRVNLYSGLYRTAVGDWDAAHDNFQDGMKSADLIGDRRLWCEHVASAEMIYSPWSLTQVFRDIPTWLALIDRLEEISLERDDVQVLACAHLGRLRGNLCLGEPRKDLESRTALAELIGGGGRKLEVIHYVEGAGLLATAAIEAGDYKAAGDWLAVAQEQLKELHAGMKSRTLPALTALFDACLHQVGRGEEAVEAALGLAHEVERKLRTFSRIYPIGRPYLLRSRGDLAFLAGHRRKAVRHWQASFTHASDRRMRAAAAMAAQRLRALGENGAEAALVDDTKLFSRLNAETSDVRNILHHFLSTTATRMPPLAGHADR